MYFAYKVYGKLSMFIENVKFVPSTTSLLGKEAFGT